MNKGFKFDSTSLVVYHCKYITQFLPQLETLNFILTEIVVVTFAYCMGSVNIYLLFKKSNIANLCYSV